MKLYAIRAPSPVLTKPREMKNARTISQITTSENPLIESAMLSVRLTAVTPIPIIATAPMGSGLRMIPTIVVTKMANRCSPVTQSARRFSSAAALALASASALDLISASAFAFDSASDRAAGGAAKFSAGLDSFAGAAVAGFARGGWAGEGLSGGPGGPLRGRGQIQCRLGLLRGSCRGGLRRGGLPGERLGVRHGRHLRKPEVEEQAEGKCADGSPDLRSLPVRSRHGFPDRHFHLDLQLTTETAQARPSFP